jgi:hypothetical protein
MYTEKSRDYGTRLLDDTKQLHESAARTSRVRIVQSPAPTGSTDKNSIDKGDTDKGKDKETKSRTSPIEKMPYQENPPIRHNLLNFLFSCLFKFLPCSFAEIFVEKIFTGNYG